MFPAHEPVDADTLARMRAYRQSYLAAYKREQESPAQAPVDDTASQRQFPLVPPPAATMASPQVQRGDIVQRLLPLVAHAEAVKKAYPEPPAELARASAAVGSRAGTGGGSSVGQKRARAAAGGRGLGTAGAAENGSNADEAAEDLEPTMASAFAEDAERSDYLGRSFLQPPVALVQLAEGSAQKPCTLPRTQKGMFRDTSAAASSSSASSSSSPAGIQLVRWAPSMYGHLLFSADIQGGVRLWNSTTRKRIASYDAHRHPVKSLDTASGATLMSSGATDGTIALWDVETGVLRSVLTNPDNLPVHQHLHHPSRVAGDLVLAAVDRRVVLYDVRVSTAKYQREYTGHMGAIFHLGLLSGGSKLLTTSEDRSMRTWDFRVPVQIKQFADASMHAITHVVQHPHSDLLAAQSLDNKVIVFKDEGGGRLELLQGKVYSGHTISGTRCQLAFSPDGVYLTSGDSSGKLFVWNWATRELVRSFKAHNSMLVSHSWHPLETSRIVTSGWDGAIKNWV